MKTTKFIIIKKLIIIVILYSSCNGKDEYSERGISTKGKITNIESIGGVGNYGTYHIDFSYKIGIKNYNGSRTINSITEPLRRALIGRTFNVIYLPEKPESAEILITKYDFESLKMKYPDSLKWIERNMK
jgi:hypothetical protein